MPDRNRQKAWHSKKKKTEFFLTFKGWPLFLPSLCISEEHRYDEDEVAKYLHTYVYRQYKIGGLKFSQIFCIYILIPVVSIGAYINSI